jgi:hypothetical protein
MFVRFCGRASTARHGQAGSVTPDCLPGSTSSYNFALSSIQCLPCSHLLTILSLRFVCFRGISLRPGTDSVSRRNRTRHLFYMQQATEETKRPQSAWLLLRT